MSDIKEILLDFLISLNEKGLINNHDFDYEEVANNFVNESVYGFNEEMIENHYAFQEHFKKTMQSHAEQHLEDVLVEYQDYIDFNEEHDRNASKSERIKSFLNLLKQRKG